MTSSVCGSEKRQQTSEPATHRRAGTRRVRVDAKEQRDGDGKRGVRGDDGGPREAHDAETEGEKGQCGDNVEDPIEDPQPGRVRHHAEASDR